jgi:primosomal protein N''
LLPISPSFQREQCRKSGVISVSEFSTGPTVIELLRRVQDTERFLRMAAIQLRRIAEQSPDIAVELQQMAQKLEFEAADLARCR